jgi:hypothetical protein
MSNAHNHHYVPQMHLRRFALPGFPGKVVVYDKLWKTTKNRAPKGQACERDLYTLNSGVSQETTIIEDEFLKRIDNDAARALDHLRAGTLDDPVRKSVSLYVSSLIMRNPKLIEQQRQHMSRVDTEIYRRMYLYDREFKDSLRQRFASQEEFEECWNAAAPGHVTIAHNREDTVLRAAELTEAIANHIFALPWILLECGGDEAFILADQPVFTCRPGLRTRSPVGLLTPGQETILPLSSRACLLIHTASRLVYEQRRATGWQAAEINQRSAYASRKRFFASAHRQHWVELMDRFPEWDGKIDFLQAPNFDLSIQAVDNSLFRPLFS